MEHTLLFAWLFDDVSLILFVVAMLFVVVHRIIDRRISSFEILYRWFMLFPAGLGILYFAIQHTVFPELKATSIGWINSPFQYQVGVAQLSLALIAILSFKASYGFRVAAVIAMTCWSWGDAAIHINQINQHHNILQGNAGSWLYTQMFIPVILIIAILKLRPKHR